MKKKNILIISAITLLLIGGVIFTMSLNSEPNDEPIGTNGKEGLQAMLEPHIISRFGIFGFEDSEFARYARFLEEFPSDKVVGPIESEQMAKEKAEEVWIEIYGEDILSKRPYRVQYDERIDLWLVQGTLLPDMLGGVPYIFIRGSDGRVLAVWHTR